MRAGLERKRQANEDRGAQLRCILDDDAARMIVDNLADDCQPQAGAVRLAGTYKRIEQ